MGDSNVTKDREVETQLRKRELFPNTSVPWQQKILASLLTKTSFEPRSRCLDAACGVGNNLVTLSRFFRKIDAFDKSSKAVEFARERFEHFMDNITFATGNLSEIPYQANSFEYVVCTEALEHVKDYEQVIKELHRVVKPGGYVILSFQNHYNPSSLFKFIFEKIYHKNWDVWGTHGHDEGYESYLTCFQIKRSVKETGFTSVREFGADYINAWLSWVPYFYRNYKVLDRFPILFLGKVPFVKYLGMDYFLLLKKP